MWEFSASFAKLTLNQGSPVDLGAANGQKELGVDKIGLWDVIGRMPMVSSVRAGEAVTGALVLLSRPPHSLDDVWLKPVLWVEYAGESASSDHGPR